MAIDGQSKSNLWAPSWDLTLGDLRVRAGGTRFCEFGLGLVKEEPHHPVD